MQTAARLAGFALALVAIFAAAAGIGNAVAPVDTAASVGGDVHESDTAETAGSAAEAPGGLMVSQDGYTLVLTETITAAGPEVPVRFRVQGPDGTPVTAYATEHEKQLHLIAVRRDLSGFQHVHPELSPDGTWSAALDLTAAGDYRLFADFRPADRTDGLTLGADLAVPGTVAPQPLPAPAPTATVDDYTVTLTGGLVPGQSSALTLTIARDGSPVTDLQPYLGAYGHLVALRAGDLAYVHVHPDGAPGDGVTAPGPDVTFWATAPSAGAYRLFLDFQHNGVVRTAEFTVQATPAGGAVPTKEDTHGHGN
jgi:hypothetical protein